MLRGGRVFSFVTTVFAVLILIVLSMRGSLGSVQSVVMTPLHFVQDGVSGVMQNLSGAADDLRDFRNLQKRNQDLEEALAIYQVQNAALYEKASDYDRLAALLDYDRQGPEDREYVSCDVIGRDTTGFVRAIQIDCGRRDGVEMMDPVVTELGMVGRVIQTSATGAEVLLITDASSSVNARLQESRADGVVQGQLSGDLVMSFIDPDSVISEGELALTNGLGQNFPADLLLGRVIGVALAPNELYQEARIRSLVDFDTLEIVQVIINFEPVDLSVFENDENTTP